MTRENKFRGKRLSDGEWVYGDLLHNVDCVKIREWEADVNQIPKSYVVDDKTVGQFTGLKDKNGVEIYEGDIVKFELDGYQVIGEVVEICGSFGIMFDELDNDVLENNTDCDNTYCGLYIDNFLTLLEIAWNFEAGFEDTFENIEVIGNKYDNPELLMYHAAITRKERERFSEQQTIFKK